MKHGHRHLRLFAFYVSVNGVRGEGDAVAHADLRPDGVDGIRERIGRRHVLRASAQSPAHRPHDPSLPVIYADRADGGASGGRICHLSRQGAAGILDLAGVDVYRGHDICEAAVTCEGVVVVVVDDLKLRVADGVGSRVARVADTAGAARAGRHGEDGVAPVPSAARPLHAEPSEAVVSYQYWTVTPAEVSPGSIFSMTRPLWS